MSARIALAAVIFSAVFPAGAAAQDALPPPLGRYDFESTTLEGDAFGGTIHIVETDSGWGGRLLTTVRPPVPLQSVTLEGSVLTVSAQLTPSLRVTFHGTLAGTEYSGSWVIEDRTEPFEARRTATDPDNNLEPAPCEVARVQGQARCGTFHVYEDRAGGTGRKIPLNIVILPASGGALEPDPLFTFAGGPGQATTDGAGSNAQRFARIREKRDIVMVDQRGTGGSNGLPCEFTTPKERALVLLAWVFPPEAVIACREQLESRADLRFYTTTIAAHDIDEVRAWLGYERINLYGGSYGTRAALEYLRLYPDRVRTATLRGVIAPSGNLALDNPRDAQASLERLFADCAEDSACGAAYDRLQRKLNTVLLRLADEPGSVRVYDGQTADTVDIEVTRDAFGGGMRRLLMDTRSQRFVPMIIERAFNGDLTPFGPAVGATLSVVRSLSFGMALSVFCAEDYGELTSRDIDYETAGTFLGPAAANMLRGACEVWPQGESPADFHEPVHADAPVLLLSGKLDPTTPPRWGDEVASTLPHSLLVVMPGISHSPFPRCALSIMADVVAAGSVDGVDTSCVADLERPPFVVSGARE
jgi:pimeloyl-ACP methyl ester carboxylesterase